VRNLGLAYSLIQGIKPAKQVESNLRFKVNLRPIVKMFHVKQPVIFDEQVCLVFVCLQQY